MRPKTLRKVDSASLKIGVCTFDPQKIAHNTYEQNVNAKSDQNVKNHCYGKWSTCHYANKNYLKVRLNLQKSTVISHFRAINRQI